MLRSKTCTTLAAFLCSELIVSEQITMNMKLLATAQRSTCIFSTRPEHRINLAELVYDKGGNADGRCVSMDLPMFGLLKWDRLEPSIALVEVSAFDTLAAFPITITFWRLSAITCAKESNFRPRAGD